MDTDDLNRILIEVVTNKPPTDTSPEALALRAQLQIECAEIIARGGSVLVPHEIPSFNDEDPNL